MRSGWHGLSLGLAIGLFTTGCGSVSPSEAYTKKLEAACARYAATEPPTTADPLAQVRQVISNLGILLPQLTKLRATPELRARSRRLLAAMRQLRTIQSSVYSDLRSGRQRNFATLEARYERVAAQLHATAAALHAPSCSRAANPRAA